MLFVFQNLVVFCLSNMHLKMANMSVCIVVYLISVFKLIIMRVALSDSVYPAWALVTIASWTAASRTLIVHKEHHDSHSKEEANSGAQKQFG